MELSKEICSLFQDRRTVKTARHRQRCFQVSKEQKTFSVNNLSWVCCIALFLHSFKMCFPSILHSSFYLFSMLEWVQFSFKHLKLTFSPSFTVALFLGLCFTFFFFEKEESKVSHLCYKCDVAAHPCQKADQACVMTEVRHKDKHRSHCLNLSGVSVSGVPSCLPDR